MQRRLTLAFLSMAVASIVLLGAGVLVLSQVGARQKARNDLSETLTSISATAQNSASFRDFRRNVDNSRSLYNLSELRFITIDTDGTVEDIPLVGRGQGNQTRNPPGGLSVTRLKQEQIENFLTGKPAFVPAQDHVTAIIRLTDSSALPSQLNGQEVGLLASHQVPLVPRQSFAWYMLSAAAVVLLSVAVASLLARRITRPIRQIQVATAAIATGQLDTRILKAGDDEIGDLATSVNEMAKELERSKGLDRQFLMSVSHDLRTPLTAVQGYGEALQDGTANNPAEAGRVIVQHAKRLNRLVSDLLDLARLEANTFTLTPLAIDPFLATQQTVEGLQAEAQARGQTLTVTHKSNESVQLSIDPDRLNQIITNLVHNALKFAETSVTASVRNLEDHIQIAVTDDGPGIDASDLPHVFERLYVAKHQPKVAENSSGLGLAIVRELTDAMGGSVEARSEPGNGTTFTVTFPITQPHPENQR